MELETVAGWNGNWMRFLLLKRYICFGQEKETTIFQNTIFNEMWKQASHARRENSVTQCIYLEFLALVHLKIHDVRFFSSSSSFFWFFVFSILVLPSLLHCPPSFLASFPISIRFSSIYFHILLFAQFPSIEWNANEKLKVTK